MICDVAPVHISSVHKVIKFALQRKPVFTHCKVVMVKLELQLAHRYEVHHHHISSQYGMAFMYCLRFCNELSHMQTHHARLSY